jgi:hypothetical protein
LLTEEERTGGVGMERYVSQAGWEVFRFHMLAQYQALDEMRARSRHNRETPIFTHCYSYAMPRNVGAGLGVGPWLYPSLKAYSVPESDWLPLASHFIDLLHDDVIAATEIGGLHILDTRMLIPPASSNPDVADPLWLNEIHPTASGYDLIAPAFVSLIESVLG